MKLNGEKKVEISELLGKWTTFANPYSYYLLKNNSLNERFDFIFADGSLLVYLYNFILSINGKAKSCKIKRYSFDFSSLAEDFFIFSKKNNIKIAIVGGCKDEIEKTVSVIESKYSVNIVYYRDGFFELNDKHIYAQMCNADIDFLISSMGTPRQEEFLLRVKDLCPNISSGITCGGFVTQTAVKPDYYHPIVKKLGLRWLQRAIEFRHVRKRLLNDYPLFVFHFLYENLICSRK
ncbi:WecB/TagA/CpsF family glycosyltransferase [Vibrio cholerae]